MAGVKGCGDVRVHFTRRPSSAVVVNTSFIKWSVLHGAAHTMARVSIHAGLTSLLATYGLARWPLHKMRNQVILEKIGGGVKGEVRHASAELVRTMHTVVS